MTEHESDRPADTDPLDQTLDEPKRLAESTPDVALAPVEQPWDEIEATDTADLEPEEHIYEERWSDIQSSFIDEPRQAVESAAALVADRWAEIERAIAEERDSLEGLWSGTETSTEDLRVALQDYRALYTRLTEFRSGRARPCHQRRWHR